MKRMLSYLLLLALLCSLCSAFAGAAENGSPEKELQWMERTLSFVEEKQELPEPELIAAQTRAPEETGLITIAPLMKRPATLFGREILLRNLLFSYGMPNQYYCVAIYANLYAEDQEPLDVYVEQFPEEAGIYSLQLTWDGYIEKTLYSFDVVYFTVVEENGELVPVEESFSYVQASAIMEENLATRMGFYTFESMENPENPTHLAKLNLQMNEESAAIAQVQTWPCTSQGDLQLTYDRNYMTVDNLDGLLIFEPKQCGWVTLRASLDHASAELPIEICTQPNGHQMLEPEIVSEPTETENGITRYRCGVCDAYYEERTWINPPVFIQFTDVIENDWYCDAVQFVVDRGLFNGVGPDQFAPHDVMTRAMLVTVLYRYSGDSVAWEPVFDDVSSGTWYSAAVTWAAQNGVVNGVGNGKFDPEGTITREQLATILYRYATKIGADTSARAELNFPDTDRLSSWAADGMQWAVAEGLIQGSGTGSDVKLLPDDGATRAQVATVLMRFIQKLQEATPEQ